MRETASLPGHLSAFLIAFSCVWMITGFVYSHQIISDMYVYKAFSFGSDYRDFQFFGSDYNFYKLIKKNTHPNSTFLVIVPDPYYVVKTSIFLYPRKITFLSDPKLFTQLQAEEQFDYVYFYWPNIKYVGVIDGLYYWVKEYSWKPEYFFTIAKQFDNNLTIEQFLARLTNNDGNMLFSFYNKEN